MKLELMQKTRATITAIEPLREKRGQTDSVAAVGLSVLVPMQRETIAMVSPKLHDFLWQVVKNPKEPPLVEGEKVYELTEEAKAIGNFGYGTELTGYRILIYWGAGINPLVRLQDGKVSKVKVSPEDTKWDLEFRFYSAKDIDEEVLGHLGVLKSVDVEIEIIPPKMADNQPSLLDQKRAAKGGGKQTPQGALAAQLGMDEDAADAAG